MADNQIVDRPPIAALFAVNFDIRRGYEIIWAQQAGGIQLDGIVDYKSLPSGSHSTSEDLVYFVHGEYVGLSAFINRPSQTERGATMLAVGILVLNSYGRLGRSWQHVQSLKELADVLADDLTKTEALQAYWDSFNGKTNAVASPIASPVIPRAPMVDLSAASVRAVSFAEPPPAESSGRTLPPEHPALSMLDFLNMFGPLVFPIYRAALLRERIVLLVHSPVEKACKYVYDISVLSTLPNAVSDVLGDTHIRLKPLFSVGVSDISLLEEFANTNKASLAKTDPFASPDIENVGWVACTTDAIIGQKQDLYDMKITLPAPTALGEGSKSWPTIEHSSSSNPILATQRDLKRYRALRSALRRINFDESSIGSGLTGSGVLPELFGQLPGQFEDELPTRSDEQDEEVCEKVSWPELAYTSFMWWASAGEQPHGVMSRSDEADEDESLPLLSMFGPPSQPRSLNRGYHDAEDEEEDAIDHSSAVDVENSTLPRRRAGRQPKRRYSGFAASNDSTEPALEVITYFHRFTTRFFTILSSILDDYSSASPVSSASDQARQQQQAESNEEAFLISSQDVQRLGLDVWSENDRLFLREMCRRWFGRDVTVEKPGVECCGWSIC